MSHYPCYDENYVEEIESLGELLWDVARNTLQHYKHDKEAQNIHAFTDYVFELMSFNPDDDTHCEICIGS